MRWLRVRVEALAFPSPLGMAPDHTVPGMNCGCGTLGVPPSGSIPGRRLVDGSVKYGQVAGGPAPFVFLPASWGLP